jgi:hypothetical protein
MNQASNCIKKKKKKKKKRVKCKVIPLQARCAQRVGRGIALLFHDCGTRRA